MLDFMRVADLLSGLSLMRYFPADDGARLELAKLVARMASTEDQVEWLVQRAIAVYSEWPGPHELRACFCSKFRPADGISACSTVYLDGLPSERPAEPLPALPPGVVASIDPSLEFAVKTLARSKDIDRPRRIAAPEVPTNPDYKPITQADIDKAMEALRDSWARKELGLE